MPTVEIPFTFSYINATWPEAVNVGGASSISDASDATYAQVSVRAVLVNLPGGGFRTENRWDVLAAVLDAQALRDTEAASSGAAFVNKFLVIRTSFPNWSSSVHGSSAPAPRFATETQDWSFQSFGPPLSNRTGIYNSEAGIAQRFINDLLIDGRGFFHAYNFQENFDSTKPNGGSLVERIYYAAIRYFWPDDVELPAVRQYPRDDGLGVSSSPRIFPEPRGSGRVVGAYP